MSLPVAIRDWLGRRPRKGDPRLVCQGDLLDLRFEPGVSQSRMRVDAPDALVVDYTRTMLGALLLQPAPRRIGVVGLGGGSQVKFCLRHLPEAKIEAFEIDPRVLAMRRDFRIPRHHPRLQVVLGDAAELLPMRPGAYDLLLVDGYDITGIPAALSTQAFADACRNALTEIGALASNLYCDDHAAHFARLQRAFGGNALLLDEPAQSNRVAFAWGTAVTVTRTDPQTALRALDPVACAQLTPVIERLGQVIAKRSASVQSSGA